jgi:hypothetical protein
LVVLKKQLELMGGFRLVWFVGGGFPGRGGLRLYCYLELDLVDQDVQFGGYGNWE